MLANVLKEAFSNFHAGFGAWNEESVSGGSCNTMLTRAIEHVVDETDTRIRAVPRYTQRLREPVEEVFQLVDDLVEGIPPPVSCRRSTYTQDDRVRALFAGPDHLQKVFSESENVRSYFDENAVNEDCWALLCMQKDESTRTGMAQVNGKVVRDVLQTVVSFTDHQLMSPGQSEEDARCALKSCIFNSLLAHSKLEARDAMRAEGQHAHMMTPSDRLQFVINILEDPGQYVSEHRCRLRLNNTNVLLDSKDKSGYEIELSEITVASHKARVALLVKFPRTDLLPKPEFSRMADIFLAS